MEEGSGSRTRDQFDAISANPSPSPDPCAVYRIYGELKGPKDQPVHGKHITPKYPKDQPRLPNLDTPRLRSTQLRYHPAIQDPWAGYHLRIQQDPFRRKLDYLRFLSSFGDLRRDPRGLTICLPPHREKLHKGIELSYRSFLKSKKKWLRKLKLPWKIHDEPLEFCVSTDFTIGEVDGLLDKMICTARILLLDELELYFADIYDRGPFSPINELESLNAVLNALKSHPERSSVLHIMELEVLCRMTTLARDNAESNSDTSLYTEHDHSFDKLENWLLSNDMRTKLKIANVSEGGRGLVALEDIYIGDVVLEVPLSLTIWEGVLTSELLEKFSSDKNITYTEILLLWIIKERLNPESNFKIYFETLPEEFKIGLNLGKDALALLKGSNVISKIKIESTFTDREFTRLQSIVERNCILPREHFTPQRYMQTRQLWLSNGIDTVTHDGTLQRCLVPFAGFFNHSLFPHVLRCDRGASSLKFIASRPCSKGQQCYLSYGNFGRSKLFSHYGFLPEGFNFNDVIRISNDLGLEQFGPYVPGSRWYHQMVRNECYLPPKLVNHFQTLFSNLDRHLYSIQDKKMSAIRMLKLHFEGRLFCLNYYGKGSMESNEKLEWDVQLALKYNAIERAIYEKSISACNDALKGCYL